VITPRLFRKSLRGALQWRLLLMWWVSLLVPGAVAALPVFTFLSRQLDHSPRAAQALPWMDGAMFLDLLRQLGENGTEQSIGLGLAGAALMLLFISPFLAGATVAAARSDEPLPLQNLLAGAGEFYGRMLRTFVAGLIPLGIGGGLAAGAMKLVEKANQHAVTETAAGRHLRVGLAAAGALVFVAHLLVDTARAQFAADSRRRSALLALWSSVRLFLRRPLRAIGIGALGAAVGLGLAGALMALRLQIAQAGPFTILVAWALAQGAHLAVGWGRATRIFGLAELTRADAADRDRAESFRMEPPATSPPPAAPPEVQSATLAALEPPPPPAAR
jgi:hypothetical protein